MKSPTYGIVTIKDIAVIIKNKIKDNPGLYNLMIGTDSQTYDKTKVVSVIALHHIGYGGIYFYDISYIPRVTNINRKMLYETSQSINLATQLVDELENFIDEDFDYTKYINLKIHVDVGLNGDSKQTIPEILGWIKSCGFNVDIKPESYAASSIANKYSK